jgi:hypothetical protein
VALEFVTAVLRGFVPEAFRPRLFSRCVSRRRVLLSHPFSRSRRGFVTPSARNIPFWLGLEALADREGRLV